MLNPTEHIIQIASEYYNGKVNRSFIVYAMSMKFKLLYNKCLNAKNCFIGILRFLRRSNFMLR